MNILGMFEIKDGLKYTMYNKINADQFTWRKYDKQLRINKHNILELVFNISDAHLLGSSDSVDKIKEIISKYQLQFDYFELYKDA